MTITPSLVMRLPASRASRIAASAGREILLVSKRSCAAVETLLTFWPPGPEARTNEISMSSWLIVRSREIRSMASPGGESARRIAGLGGSFFVLRPLHSPPPPPPPPGGGGGGGGGQTASAVLRNRPHSSSPPQAGERAQRVAFEQRASIRLR